MMTSHNVREQTKMNEMIEQEKIKRATEADRDRDISEAQAEDGSHPAFGKAIDMMLDKIYEVQA